MALTNHTGVAARKDAADRRTTSAICNNCVAKGLVLRQIIPMVRWGCGGLNREMLTLVDRVSTATAISGIRVTPIPALTIWTSVVNDEPSSNSRGCEKGRLQNDNA